MYNSKFLSGYAGKTNESVSKNKKKDKELALKIFNSNKWINPITKNTNEINYKEKKELKEHNGWIRKFVSLKEAIEILIYKYKITTDINLAIYLLEKYNYDIEQIKLALYDITKYEDVFNEEVKNIGYGLNNKTINYTLSCQRN